MKKFLLFLFITSLLFSEPKKVFFVSLPKSGTHMLFKAFQLMYKERPRWIGLADSEYFNPLWDLTYPNKVTAGHLFPFPNIDKVRLQFSDSYAKVLLIRDPRALMVSFASHIRKGMMWAGCPTFHYEHFLQLSSDEQLREILLFPHLNPASCFEYAVKWIRDPTVFVCRYEDLVGAKGGGSDLKQFETMRKLADFIGCELTDGQLRAICEQLYGGTWTFNKGKTETWRTAYSPENKELFMKLYGKYISQFGYQKKW